MKRIIFDVLLFLIVIIFPWWVSVLFGLFILYYLKSFFEFVLFGLLLDICYGTFSYPFNVLEYKFTLLFLVLLLSSFFIKKRIRF